VPSTKYLWWVSQDTFDRALEEAVNKGYLPESALLIKGEAQMYKGLSKTAGTLDLIDGLCRVARDHAPTASRGLAARYEEELAELPGIYRRLLADGKVDN
jgi:hypothetical protein